MSPSILWRRRGLTLARVVAVAALFALAPVAESQTPQPFTRFPVVSVSDAKSALAVRDAFLGDMDDLHDKVIALARAIPEDKYDWRPTPEVRTVGNVLIHMAMEWYFVLPAAVGGKMTTDWPDFPEARTKLFAITAKKDVLDQVERAWGYARNQVTAATAAQLIAARPDSTLRTVKLPLPPPMRLTALTAMSWQAGDSHEHLGQLITYARSIGVVPPWSR
jgi:DinB superfamily